MASARGLLFVFFSSLLCSACTFPALAGKVSLAVYYETLCPYCSSFIVDRLSNIFRDGLVSIVDLHLVPYGNSMVDPSGAISCQNGQYECLLNTVEACAMSSHPLPQEHFGFIYCVERLVKNNQYSKWGACFQQTGFDAKAVVNCYNSGYGTKLELLYKAKTEALQPPRTYVPWVTVNGQPLYNDYDNFEAYICKAYKGQRPKACQELLLTISEEKKANKSGQFYPVGR